MIQPKHKVLIGIPCNENVNIQFTIALLNLVLYSFGKGIHCSITVQQSSIIEIGRSEIVANAINLHEKLGIEYLFTIDSDMVFPPDTIVKLIEHNKEVVCCDAVRRRPPYTQVVIQENGEKIDHINCMEDLVKLKGASLACSLLKIETLKKIPLPHFKVEWRNNSFLGEDFYFTELLKKEGIDVWCDVNLSKKIGHIGSVVHYINAQ